MVCYWKEEQPFMPTYSVFEVVQHELRVALLTAGILNCGDALASGREQHAWGLGSMERIDSRNVRNGCRVVILKQEAKSAMIENQINQS
jgi:hypothetical protein